MHLYWPKKESNDFYILQNFLPFGLKFLPSPPSYFTANYIVIHISIYRKRICFQELPFEAFESVTQFLILLSIYFHFSIYVHLTCQNVWISDKYLLSKPDVSILVNKSWYWSEYLCHICQGSCCTDLWLKHFMSSKYMSNYFQI